MIILVRRFRNLGNRVNCGQFMVAEVATINNGNCICLYLPRAFQCLPNVHSCGRYCSVLEQWHFGFHENKFNRLFLSFFFTFFRSVVMFATILTILTILPLTISEFRVQLDLNHTDLSVLFCSCPICFHSPLRSRSMHSRLFKYN